MLKALIVLAVIAAALFLLGMIKISFRIAYADEVTASVKVLFVKLRLLPKKKKRIKLRDFGVKRFRRRLKKRLKASEKKALKKQRKAEKKKAKKEKEEQKIREKNGGELPPKKKKSLSEILDLVKRLLRAFISRFPKYLRTDTARLVIGVASDDAAKTAITYGVTVQSVQYLVTLMREHTDFRVNKNAVVSVYPDFLSEKWTADIDLTFSIRMWQVLAVGIEVIMAYLKLGKYGRAVKRSTVKSTEETPSDLSVTETEKAS